MVLKRDEDRVISTTRQQAAAKGWDFASRGAACVVPTSGRGNGEAVYCSVQNGINAARSEKVTV